MRPFAVLLIAVALGAAGCGGGSSDASSTLHRTMQRLGKITSGNLLLRLVVTPRSGTSGRVGFVVSGPFALRRSGLPLLDVRYTQLTGPRSATARLVSDGNRAVAVVSGRQVALPAASVAQLRGAGGTSTGGGIVSPLHIESWLKSPQVSDGGVVGGTHTDRISGDLDAVNAANGLLALLRQLGRSAPTISGTNADHLRKAVTSSSIDIWTGKSDRLLRRLALNAQLAFDVPAQLRRAFGAIVGAHVEFVFAIGNPNERVHVALPPA
jgi:hypothetical protein